MTLFEHLMKPAIERQSRGYCRILAAQNTLEYRHCVRTPYQESMHAILLYLMPGFLDKTALTGRSLRLSLGRTKGRQAAMTVDDAVERLERLLSKSRHAVLFSGAGISTESGIPDYRSPGGVWDKFRPIDFQEFLASETGQREFWRRKFATHDMIADAVPNRGHRAIAKLVADRRVTCVITQNVDGLHQKAGVSETKVIELHGNTTYAACLDCGERYDLAPIRTVFLADESLPVCAACSGLVKTGTISFGQAMPEEPMRRADQESRQADLMIAVGSSLVVYPAAGFPVVAKRSGAAFVIVNREATELDAIADLVIHGEIGPILGPLAGVD